VLGVNDFDEAVVYDFQIDIWRLAISMYDHSLSNGEHPQHRPHTLEWLFCAANPSATTGRSVGGQ
jgi:uncharacterized protein (DUF2252 family)